MEIIKEGYTRVSEILNQWDKFSNIKDEVLENKRNIGTRVHDAIDNHIKGIYTPLEASDQGYFDSFLQWEKSVPHTIVKCEERYYCDVLMITGKVDLIVQFPDEKNPVLVDLKTSASASKEMWQLQGAFYQKLCSMNGLTLADRMLFLQLDKNGAMPKVHEYKYTNQLYRLCEASYLTYKYLKEWIAKRQKEKSWSM